MQRFQQTYCGDGWCRVGKKVPDREQVQGTEVRVGLGEQKN